MDQEIKTEQEIKRMNTRALVEHTVLFVTHQSAANEYFLTIKRELLMREKEAAIETIMGAGLDRARKKKLIKQSEETYKALEAKYERFEKITNLMMKQWEDSSNADQALMDELLTKMIRAGIESIKDIDLMKTHGNHMIERSNELFKKGIC